MVPRLPDRARVASALSVAVLALALSSRVARADEGRAHDDDGDTTHGRLAGDVALAPAAGVVLGPRAPRLALDMRARYIEAVGLFVTYEDALGQEKAEPTRALATGVELRPLFLGRWLKGLEGRSAWMNLAVDSLGFEVGVAFAKARGTAFGDRPALQVGLGLEVPLLGAAEGPWVGAHGGLRFGESAMSGAPVQGPLDRAAFVAITVAWHAYVDAHLVDQDDRRVGVQRPRSRAE